MLDARCEKSNQARHDLPCTSQENLLPARRVRKRFRGSCAKLFQALLEFRSDTLQWNSAFRMFPEFVSRSLQFCDEFRRFLLFQTVKEGFSDLSLFIRS